MQFEFWHFLDNTRTEVVEITTEEAVIYSVENKKKENEKDYTGLLITNEKKEIEPDATGLTDKIKTMYM